VVLGFQLSCADATTRDTVRSALGIKEQQQALILQRRREEQRLAAAKEGANEGESGTDQTDNSSSDEAGGKRSTGKAAGLSIKMTGPSSDGGPRVRHPPVARRTAAPPDSTHLFAAERSTRVAGRGRLPVDFAPGLSRDHALPPAGLCRPTVCLASALPTGSVDLGFGRSHRLSSI
jgi:hypothetical protein